MAVDHDGRMIDVNPAALRILGRTEAEVLGQSAIRQVGLPIDADGNRIAPAGRAVGTRAADGRGGA